MPAYKNVAEHPIKFNLEGNDPAGVQKVEPGKTFVLDEKHAYLVGTQINKAHVEEVDLDAAPAKSASVPPAPSLTPPSTEK